MEYDKGRHMLRQSSEAFGIEDFRFPIALLPIIKVCSS